MMKSGIKLLKMACFCFVLAGIVACESTPLPDPETPQALHGIFILNQGENMQNNASLSFYDPESKTVSQVTFPDPNRPGETEPLGDLGQDMIRYGNKLYIVVSNSSYIRVLNPETKQTLGKIVLEDSENKPRNPRYLAAYDGKVYVTCSTDGTVARIDTTSLAIEKSLKVGANPEGIAACSYNGKLYVANSGYGSDKTVSVINPATFEEETKIEVGLNPNFVKAGKENYLYLNYQGNFNDIPGGFQRIDLTNNTVTTLGSYPKADFVWEDGYVYYYDVTYDPTDWSVKLTYGKFDERGESYPNPSPLITDNTPLVAPYGIAIAPVTKEIYLMDAGDYANPGNVYIFDPQGRKTGTLTVGISPCKVVFY
ncbi:MAG: hypothetical protein LBB85_06880 [Dysgonamonadaceae bacterium]|jgi:YVTN family beta-propeller protein|nr:hypothetical protein [Dysgonamonadaceae bacterium]